MRLTETQMAKKENLQKSYRFMLEKENIA